MADDEAAPARPERIVSIDPSGTEIIYAIGAERGRRRRLLVLPRGHPGYRPFRLAAQPRGDSGLRADLVVMGSNSDIEAGLEAAVAVALSNAPMSFDDVYSQTGHRRRHRKHR